MCSSFTIPPQVSCLFKNVFIFPFSLFPKNLNNFKTFPNFFFLLNQTRCKSKSTKKIKKKKNFFDFAPRTSKKYLREEDDLSALKVPRWKNDEKKKKKQIAERKIIDILEEDERNDCLDSVKGGAEGKSYKENLTYKTRPIKPHEVREKLKKEKKIVGTSDDKLNLQELRNNANIEKTEFQAEDIIPSFSENDIDIQNRPELKKFRYMPNPLQLKGTYALTEEDYYKQFFQDRDRTLDGRSKEMKNILREKAEEFLTEEDHKKIRVSPNKYWYIENYKSIDISSIYSMRSRDLRVNLMNEAKLVRKGKSIDIELWRAYESRLIALLSEIKVRSILRCIQAFASAQTQTSNRFHEIILEISKRQNEMKPKHFVFLLQALSRLRWRDIYILTALKEMILCWCALKNNFLIKAANSLSKLDFASHILCHPLKNVLGYRIQTFNGRNCLLLKAITLIDLFNDEMTIEFLEKCIENKHVFTHYSRNIQLLELNLRLIRPHLYEKLSDEIKLFMENFRLASNADDEMEKLSSSEEDESEEEEEEEAEEDEKKMKDEEEIEKKRKEKKNLCVINRNQEIKHDMNSYDSHDNKNFIVESDLLFLDNKNTLLLKENESYKEKETTKLHKNMHESFPLSTSVSPLLSRNENKSWSEEGVHTQTFEENDFLMLNYKNLGKKDQMSFSSGLHKDVSYTLQTENIDHLNCVRAGPIIIDIYQPASKIVLEMNPHFQFYANTLHRTSLSKMRLNLLRSMGFTVYEIKFFVWKKFRCTEEKLNFLKTLLPHYFFEFLQ